MRWILPILLAAILPLSAQQKGTPDKRKGLIVEQVSNGIIGGEEEEREQKLLVVGDRLKLVDKKAGVVCIVRLDRRLIWEIDLNKKEYVETHFSHFEELRRQRERNRAKMVDALNRMPLLERKEKAPRMGFLLDKSGNVIKEIRAEVVETKKTAKIAGYEAQQVIIKEDGRIAFNIWLTGKLKVPQSVIRFYREAGMLSKPLANALDKVKGFPLKLEVYLDLGTVEVAAKAKVKSVKEAEIDLSEFELPKGLKCREVKKRQEEGIKTYTCANCGKKFTIDPKKGEKPFVWVRPGGKTYHFCSRKCMLEFRKKLKEQEKGK